MEILLLFLIFLIFLFFIIFTIRCYLSNRDNFVNNPLEIVKFKLIDDKNLKIVEKKLKENQWVYNPSLIDLDRTIYRVSPKTYCAVQKFNNKNDQYVIYIKNNIINDKIYEAEDPRSILINNTVYLIYNKYKPNSKQYIYNTDTKKEYEIKYSKNKDEKNWVPFNNNGNLYLIHTINPLNILHINYTNGEVLDIIKHNNNNNILETKLRGGSNLINFEKYYLGIGHKTILPERIYYHFFYIINNEYPFELINISKMFKFKFENYNEQHFNNIQFCCGLYLKDNSIILSLGIGDCYSKLIELDIDYIKKLFN